MALGLAFLQATTDHCPFRALVHRTSAMLSPSKGRGVFRRMIRRRGDRPLSLGGEKGEMILQKGDLIVFLLERGGSRRESNIDQILIRDVAED